MERLRLLVNARKTRCLRVPEEPLEFLSRVPRGTQLPLEHGLGYLGTRRSAGSVRSICRKISELTQARYGPLDGGEMVERLDRVMLGWANQFCLGQVAAAYAATDAHATKRLRQWLCRKHKVRTGKYARGSYQE